MDTKYKFGLRFKKGNFSPESSRPQDIADIITQVEKLVSALIEKQHSHQFDWKKKVEFGLSSVRPGSLVYNFVTDNDNIKEIWCVASEAVDHNNFANWPQKAIEATKRIHSFSRRYDTPAEYWHLNGGYKTLAIMMPDVVLKTDPIIRKGKTTLYGILYRIGGDPTPFADLILLNGIKQRCKVTSTKLASEMANRLYQRIGVRGIASWNITDMTLKEFRITDLTPYKQVPITQAIESLANLTAYNYQEIEDINAFVAELRGNGEDES